ncbi:cytochrome P450 [Streptomyces sp. BB1-1-1]|uniref:cytochrome P450 n=1 Tax=Streptomyces sp. BB1-1-1 TaxID=3074430 RepID=UPI0028775A31|nr:cytochrome P450 [Streptomyces sp. BB1-1-1]WND33511.1 cytochrome P450 [Streptomyces sp. BB1-1-1]
MTTDELPELPFACPHALTVPPRYAELREQAPLHRVITPAGDEAWLALGHKVVKQLMADRRLGYSHPDPDNAPRASDSVWFGGPSGVYETEEADHAKQRRLIQPYFSPKRMRTLRPRLEELTDRLLDQLEASPQPADLHAIVSFPLPALMICELLGVPTEDHQLIRRVSLGISDMTDGEHSQASLGELYAYMSELTRKKRKEPGEDLTSTLCLAEGGTLDDEYITRQAMMMVFAGHEATIPMIDIGVLMLLAHPEAHHELLDDMTLLPSALDEILRIAPHSEGWAPRYAKQDLDIGGVRVKAGELVLLDRPSADHDGEVHPDPETFDIRRSPNPHIAFGQGDHYCMGAPLARLQLEILFSRLLPRFPGLRPALPIEEMPARKGKLTAGFEQVLVTW